MKKASLIKFLLIYFIFHGKHYINLNFFLKFLNKSVVNSISILCKGSSSGKGGARSSSSRGSSGSSRSSSA